MGNCTIVYGLSRDIKHEETVSVKEAFDRLPDLKHHWLFVNVYYQDRLVYTTQGCAGYRWQCDDCPYHLMNGKHVTNDQYKMIYGG